MLKNQSKKKMPTKTEILNFLRENKDLFKKKFHIAKIGLFGSFARNEQNPDSDIDILIELENDATDIFDLEWDIRELLKKRFNTEVDICEEKYIKSYFKPYILKDAIYV